MLSSEPHHPTTPDPGAMRMRHEALFYSSSQELVAAVVAFAREGLSRGLPVFVALPEPTRGLVRDRLGDLADDVALYEMESLGRNPSRIIPAMAQFLQSHPERPVYAVGEPIWSTRSPAELRECIRHEALINTAFGHEDLWWICPYDASTLAPDVVREAWHTHPLVSEDGEVHDSGGYRDPALVAALDESLAGPASTGAEIAVETGELASLRDFLRREAGAVGLDESRVDDLVLAANEVATNLVRHGGMGTAASGGPVGRARVWQDSGELVCEVSGPGLIDDPLVGRWPPSVAPEGGRGLWLVNQVCDLVELRSGRHGTVVRLRLAL